MTVYLFHVVEEKTQKVLVVLQVSSKKPSNRKKLSNSFDIKNWADVLVASDWGSHVEQATGEKLIPLDEEERKLMGEWDH